MRRRSQPIQPSEWQWRSRSPRVLIENADPAIGHAVENFLLEEGFQVAYCTGPGDDLGRCPLVHDGVCPRAAAADVVLTSLPLTDTDPHEVLVRLRRHFPGTPVIVEIPAPKIHLYPDLLNGCQVIEKPMTRERVISAIRHTLAISVERTPTPSDPRSPRARTRSDD